ncbi:MAG: class I SAM-dependent methyltransferase [Actinomycetota bacterium]
MNELNGMRDFWEQKAHENPLWYVATTLDFASPDEKQFWLSGEQEVERVLGDAKTTQGVCAAEVGCGIGRLTRALVPRFETVHAFDVSPKMIELARKNVPSANFSVTSGDGSIPLPSSSVDFVLSMQVFHHIPMRQVTLTYLREAGRVLKPGGALGFQLRTTRFGDRVLGSIERFARNTIEASRRRRTPPPQDLDAPAWHGSRVLRSEIRKAAGDAGMKIESMRWLVKGNNAQFICRKVSR